MFDAAKLRIISEYTKYYIKKIPNKSYFLCFFLLISDCHFLFCYLRDYKMRTYIYPCLIYIIKGGTS